MASKQHKRGIQTDGEECDDSIINQSSKKMKSDSKTVWTVENEELNEEKIEQARKLR